MALTRKLLQGMGLTEEQIESIITEHTATTTGLKDKLDEANTKLETAGEVAKRAETLEKELSKLKDEIKKGDWESKYAKEHEDFEAYKTSVAEKETADKVRSEYRKLLADCNVRAQHLDDVLQTTDLKGMKLGEDGKLENADELTKAIKAKWGWMIGTEGIKPSGNPETPPAGVPAKKSMGAVIAQEYHDNRYGKTTKGE